MNRTSIRRMIAPSVAALAVGAVLTGCGAANEGGSDSGSGLSGKLNGSGSSAQEAAMDAWRSAFQKDNSGVTVNYDPAGSGAGVEKFNAGGVDFAGSDSPLSEDGEIAAAKKRCGADAIEVPDYVSPIALVYNLDGVDDLQLSAKTAANIFDGTIKTWDDAAIKAENPDAKLPSTAISPVHRSDESGTTANFTDYLAQASDGAWTFDADKVWPIKSGEGASGTSGVISAVTNGAGSIGYADDSQAGELSKAKLKVGEEYVAPSAEGAGVALGRLPARGRSSRERHGRQGRPDHHRGGRLPAVPRVVPDRLPVVRRQGQGRGRQGLPVLHRLRRGPAGRGRQRGLRPDPRGARQEGAGAGRLHQGRLTLPCPPRPPGPGLRGAASETWSSPTPRAAPPSSSWWRWPGSRSSSPSRACRPSAPKPDDLNGAANFWRYALPLVFGTLWAAFLALVIATPLAIGVALAVSHYAPRRIATTLGYLIDLLAAVPSVVYGLWGIGFLAPRMVPFYEWSGAKLGWLPFFTEPASSTGRTIQQYRLSSTGTVLLAPACANGCEDVAVPAARSRTFCAGRASTAFATSLRQRRAWPRESTSLVRS